MTYTDRPTDGQTSHRKVTLPTVILIKNNENDDNHEYDNDIKNNYSSLEDKWPAEGGGGFARAAAPGHCGQAGRQHPPLAHQSTQLGKSMEEDKLKGK